MLLGNAVQLSRRTALRAGVTGAMMAALGAAPHTARAATATSPANRTEPDAGGWKTWVLDSGAELRPAAPPDRPATRSELEQLRSLTGQRDAAALDQVSYWDTGAPGFRWNAIAHRPGTQGRHRDRRVSRPCVAQRRHLRRDGRRAGTRNTTTTAAPSEADPSLTTVLPNPNSPSYPSEHAAAAGAASAVLAYLFPNDAQVFLDRADMARPVAPDGRSRVPE